MAGFQHLQSTPYGSANFWTITDIRIGLGTNPPNTSSLSLSMAGFPTQADAAAGATPIGTYQINAGPAAIAAFFGGAQANFIAFIQAAWPDAVYITP